MDGAKYADVSEAKVGIAKDKREIERVIDTLENEIRNTQNLVSTLLDTIEPITRTPCPTEEGNEKEKGTETPLGGQLYSYVCDLRMTNDSISDVLNRIEL